MQAVILFLNDKPDDPTKRLKLAGVRRYAAAAGWKVVPVLHDRSGPKSIPGLFAEHCPVGCIFDADGDPLPIAPRHFADVPVVFANSAKRAFDRFAGRLCVDAEAVTFLLDSSTFVSETCYACPRCVPLSPRSAARQCDIHDQVPLATTNPSRSNTH